MCSDQLPPPEEVAVFALHVQGLPDKAIAGRLGVSLGTVRRRADRLRRRTGARTRAEVVAMLIAAGQLQAPVRTCSQQESECARRTVHPGAQPGEDRR